MTHYYPASADVHNHDPHWDYEEEDEMTGVYTTQRPPCDVLSVRDADGDIWSREGDRWYVSFQPSRVAFGNSGDTPDDLRVYHQWWEMEGYGPFTEAV